MELKTRDMTEHYPWHSFSKGNINTTKIMQHHYQSRITQKTWEPASLAPLVTASNPGQTDGIPICPGLHKCRTAKAWVWKDGRKIWGNKYELMKMTFLKIKAMFPSIQWSTVSCCTLNSSTSSGCTSCLAVAEPWYLKTDHLPSDICCIKCRKFTTAAGTA